MDMIYSLMTTLLPFDWLSSNFMKNAFLAVLLVTPLFGLISTMVVSNRMAFFSDSLGHGAFTGIAIGVLLGSVSPLLSLVVFSVVFALFITYIKNKSTASTDTIIVVFVLGLIAWGLLFNQLLVLSINSSFARSRGIPAFWIESAFASLLAVVVSISIQWVGILIINAMLVLPAAGARNIANNVKQYHLFSMLIAMFSGFLGLMLAYYFDMAAGATIVVISSVLFFLTLLLKPYFSR